ncbi:MAG: PocR ligand-binding domain-containing protein [Clostridia bacterium]|nr:PocR ligand-binding domain-containing protein [Clostridia bacterium]
MHVNYNKEKIEGVLADFYNATGVNIQFFDKNLRSYGAKFPHNKYCYAIQATKQGICKLTDRALVEKSREAGKATMHICHAGLVDIAVPVIYNEAILGYIILGQMRRDDDFSPISDYIMGLGLDSELMRENYLSLPLYDNDRIQSVLNLATIIAKYILLDHLLIPGFNSVMQRAVDFMDENLHLDISTEDIAAAARVSKSTLYKNFKDILGCTVGDFLMKKRIERAEGLLIETEMTVQEISQKVGFSSAAYFTANFKKVNGVPPLRFKKNNT